MIRITENTGVALASAQLQKNLAATLGKTLHSRDQAVSEVSNWEELRQYAHDVKTHTLARLGHYLQQLEQRVIEQGGKVVWAETAEEAVHFILELAHQKGIRKVVKSKSMLTQEIHLNEELERAQIQAVETDLGEYIVQLAQEAPSHLIAPAIHKSRGEIADLFAEKLGIPRTEDAKEITRLVRKLLRSEFLTARMGISGLNFAVAETGTIVIVENEGNARLSISVPQVHVALMGIEKVIPRSSDLAVFLKLLARSATGQKMTCYVNFINGVRRAGELDGPQELYLVLLDNGRSKILADDFLSQTLSCIRCGACLNVCPVYQRIGGHAYGSAYQGPIGAILTPQLFSVHQVPEHPFASSLCGACHEICPVKIEIPHILLKLREKVQQQLNAKTARLPLEKWAMQIWAWVMCSPARYIRLGRWMRFFQKFFVRKGKLRIPFPPLNRWVKHRELPSLAAKTFSEIYQLEKTRANRRPAEEET